MPLALLDTPLDYLKLITILCVVIIVLLLLPFARR